MALSRIEQGNGRHKYKVLDAMTLEKRTRILTLAWDFFCVADFFLGRVDLLGTLFIEAIGGLWEKKLDSVQLVLCNFAIFTESSHKFLGYINH